MRCLSIRQPWAWLICAGKKTVENRVWQTPYRGTIAIHASTTKSEVGRLKKGLETNIFSANDFVYGAIVGFADIVDIQPYGREHEDDGFASGPYCFRLANGCLLREPVPMMGKLNLFVLDEAIAAQLDNAETYQVHVTGDSPEARIANTFNFEPDAVGNYAATIEELIGKVDDELLYAMCTRMIELEPDGGDGHVQRCKLALQTGRTDNMNEDVNRMLAVFPDDDEVAGVGAEVLAVLGNFEQAKPLLERLLRAQPEAPGYLVMYGHVLFEIGDFNESARQFLSALEHGANTDDQELCHLMLARAYHRLEQLDLAFHHIEKAKSYDSSLAIINTVAARIALKQGRSDDARREVATALEIDPEYPNALQIQDELKALA